MMADSMQRQWHETNQRYLMTALSGVRAALENAVMRSEASQERGGSEPQTKKKAPPKFTPPLDSAPPTLEVLVNALGLSSFECSLLLLCAGIELDSGFAPLCAEVQGDPKLNYPTFSLALGALPDAHWSALSPQAPLRYWRLIGTNGSAPLTQSVLQINERVLHFLTGVNHLDEHLSGYIDPVEKQDDLAASHQRIADLLIQAWSKDVDYPGLPVGQLIGDDSGILRAIAAQACDQIGLDLYRISDRRLPSEPRELGEFVRLWEREAILLGSALLLECSLVDAADAPREAIISRLVENMHSPLIIAGQDRRYSPFRTLVTLDVGNPTPKEQQELWLSCIDPDHANHLDGHIDTLVSQFDISGSAIRAVCGQAFNTGSSSDFAMTLWDACCVQTRPRLENLAQRIQPFAGWDDLVLPKAQTALLREIAVHVRQRMKVYQYWGFAGKSNRGLGICALFSGTSGTGKTMAGEVLADELNLDLFRIDLSQVVSKYIGETEKNLRKVFDAADSGGAILLFDEADALFGKRSEIRDSHDRYANIEISYLLQRMETYRGLAILTTNLISALDTAFLRRIRFIVQFPFPDADLRAEIWRTIFPEDTPRSGLDFDKLAQLNVTGGSIRNIALHAAFQAAEEGVPVQMRHLKQGARFEYAKLEKSLTSAEIRGWL
jgi:hypothetical protein